MSFDTWIKLLELLMVLGIVLVVVYIRLVQKELKLQKAQKKDQALDETSGEDIEYNRRD